MSFERRLIIIDGNSLVHRAFHALPPLKTKKGKLVNACYGFLLIFLKSLKIFKPDFVVATFDSPGPTFRHKEFKEYKAKRPPAPKELYQQIETVKEILRAFNIPIFEKKGFEADDLIATISYQASRKQVYPQIENIILSGDLDNLQLVDENTKVCTLKKGIKDTILYDIEAVKKRYQGLNPSQLTDFKALRGDPSDNIPGVTGIGEKTAIQLIEKFGTLENLYREIEKETEKSKEIKENIRKRLKEYKEQAFISRSLVQMKSDVPLDFNLKNCRFDKFDKEKIIGIFKELEFYTLIERLEEFKKQQSSLFPTREKQKIENETGKIKGETEQINEEIEKLYQDGIFSQKIYRIEKKLVPIVKEMEENGIKIDLKKLRNLAGNFEKRLQKLRSEIYNLATFEFNLNSPQQLAIVLFKKLKLPVDALKKTPRGFISTSSQELQKIKKVHPIIDLILKYRRLFKLKSAFIEKLADLIDPRDKRIHPHFHQLGTETGRMSCSEPNLQNIPRKGEFSREIRKCFVAESDYKFLSVDYSQMELRIAAALSGDIKMIELFKKGKDIHKLTAAEVFQIPENKISEKERYFAKTLNFGVLYGMSVKGFSERTNLSLGKSKEFIKKYFKNFVILSQYRENLIKDTQKKGFVETFFGRKRFLPEINSIDIRLRNQAERMAISTKIQGTASDIIKMAMVELKDKGIIGGDCKLILQIHDELLFEIKKCKIKKLAPKIKKIMESIVDFKVPLKVEIKIGNNWGKLTDDNML